MSASRRTVEEGNASSTGLLKDRVLPPWARELQERPQASRNTRRDPAHVRGLLRHYPQRHPSTNPVSQVRKGFPGGTRGKEPAYQCRRRKRCGFDPWVGKIPWKRAWKPTPVFLPGKSRGQRSLVSYSPRGGKESDATKHKHDGLNYHRLSLNFRGGK